MNERKIIIAFDSECTLCTRFKKGIELLDKSNRIDFISVHDEALYIKHPQLNKEECLEKVHLIDSENSIYSGGEVMSFLIKLFPTAEKLAWLIDSESSQKAMNVFYDKVNDLRKKALKKCPNCNKGHNQR